MLPAGENGRLFLRGVFLEGGIHLEVHAFGLPTPESEGGFFEVILSSSTLLDDLDLGALEPDSHGDAELVFSLAQDRREFALAADTFSLFDGDTEIATQDVLGGFALRMSGHLRIQGGNGPITFEMVGKVTRRPDGTLSNEFRGKCRGADVGTYTLRFRGPGDNPIDVTLDVQTARRAVQARVSDTSEVLDQVLDFDEFAVLEGDTELGFAPLLCR
ncbi:MAG: hypothetical protein HY292_03030 [Planctomycetes bacterium]|nr:hypothetical protein [Planctomycetota bacterium]